MRSARVVGKLFTVSLTLLCGGNITSAQQVAPARQLIREVVYNELHDHEAHTNWRYWVKQRLPEGTKFSDQVETHDGPVTRVLLVNGQPLDERTRETEQAKLDALMSSRAEQENRRAAYAEDEKRVGRILSLLPDAFVIEEAGTDGDCRHFRFRPDSAYNAKSIEAKIFHGVSGDLWINSRMKRLIKLQGHIDEDLTFGFGLLGRVNKGSWFRMERTQVSPTEWKTRDLEIHMSGKAVLFKTVAREISETRGGFTPLPTALTLNQGVRMLAESTAAVAAQIAPPAWKTTR